MEKHQMEVLTANKRTTTKWIWNQAKKKDYYLNEYLQFIEPFTASRSQTGNLQTIQGHGNFDDESESDEAHENEIDTFIVIF